LRKVRHKHDECSVDDSADHEAEGLSDCRVMCSVELQSSENGLISLADIDKTFELESELGFSSNLLK
jgi:hypothetical protein